MFYPKVNAIIPNRVLPQHPLSLPIPPITLSFFNHYSWQKQRGPGIQIYQNGCIVQKGYDTQSVLSFHSPQNIKGYPITNLPSFMSRHGMIFSRILSRNA